MSQLIGVSGIVSVMITPGNMGEVILEGFGRRLAYAEAQEAKLYVGENILVSHELPEGQVRVVLEVNLPDQSDRPVIFPGDRPQL